MENPKDYDVIDDARLCPKCGRAVTQDQRKIEGNNVFSPSGREYVGNYYQCPYCASSLDFATNAPLETNR